MDETNQQSGEIDGTNHQSGEIDETNNESTKIDETNHQSDQTDENNDHSTGKLSKERKEWHQLLAGISSNRSAGARVTDCEIWKDSMTEFRRKLSKMLPPRPPPHVNHKKIASRNRAKSSTRNTKKTTKGNACPKREDVRVEPNRAVMEELFSRAATERVTERIFGVRKEKDDFCGADATLKKKQPAPEQQPMTQPTFRSKSTQTEDLEKVKPKQVNRPLPTTNFKQKRELKGSQKKL